MPAVPATTPNLGLPRFAADSTSAVWSHLNAMADMLDLVMGTWKTYNPVWTDSNGTVLYATGGSLTGRYNDLGKTIQFVIRLQRSKDSNVGSSGLFWNFTLPPVAPVSWNLVSGSLSGVRNSAASPPTYIGGALFPASSTNVSGVVGDLGRLSNTVPAAPHGPNDWYVLAGTLERA